MKKLKKRTIIILSCALFIVLAAIITTLILLKDTSFLNATVVDITTNKQEIVDYIIDWDSNTKNHEKQPSTSTVKCSITVNSETYEYDNFYDGWVAATTTYKNKGELTFTFYSDWIAENGSFGVDEGTKGTSFINGNGGLLIKNWTNDVIIDFNGYKIDRNITDKTVNYGSVIKVDEGEDIYFKNGCITGGANTDDGGGILIYGKPYVYFVDMIITGNFTGYNGGGVYVGSHAHASFDNTTIEGNYADHYGGGVYCDYKSAPGSLRIYKMLNVVKIQNNYGTDGKKNLTLCATKYVDAAQISYALLTEDSYISVSFSRKDSKTRYIIDSKFVNTDNFQYFHSDDSYWKIKTETVLKGGGTLENPSITYDALALVKK